MREGSGATRTAMRSQRLIAGATPCEFAAVVGFDFTPQGLSMLQCHAWHVIDFSVRLGMRPLIVTRTGVDASATLLTQLRRWDLSCAGLQRDGRRLVAPASPPWPHRRHGGAPSAERAHHFLNAQLARISLLSVSTQWFYLTADMVQGEMSRRAVQSLMQHSAARVVLDVSGGSAPLDPAQIRCVADHLAGLIMTQSQWNTWMRGLVDGALARVPEVLVLCADQWLCITPDTTQAYSLGTPGTTAPGDPWKVWKAWQVAIWLLGQAWNWPRGQAARRVGEMAGTFLDAGWEPPAS